MSNEELNEPSAKEKDYGDREQRPGEEDPLVHFCLILAKSLVAARQSLANQTPPPGRLYRAPKSQCRRSGAVPCEVHQPPAGERNR